MIPQAQAARILARLKQGPATSWQLGPELGVLRLSGRIMELRRAGHVITWTERRERGRRIVTYTLQGHAATLPSLLPSMPDVSLQRNGMRKCLNPPCAVVFKPKTKRQFYHSDRCRFQDWERTHPRTGFLFGNEARA